MAMEITKQEHDIMVKLMERPLPLQNAAKRIVELERQNELFQENIKTHTTQAINDWNVSESKKFPFLSEAAINQIIAAVNAAIDGGALESE